METLKQYSVYILLANVLLTVLLAGYVYYTNIQHERVINTQGTVLLQVVDFLNKVANATSTPAK